MKLIHRDIYVDKVLSYLGKGLIVVLTGQRRVGKSCILQSVAQSITLFHTTMIGRKNLMGSGSLENRIRRQRAPYNLEILPLRRIRQQLNLDFLIWHGLILQQGTIRVVALYVMFWIHL